MAEPYTGFYSAALRLALKHLDEKLLRLFIALSSYADERGVCFPGLRELALTTGFSVELVSELLYQLEARGLMVYIRKNQRDPATKRQMPNVYMVTGALYVARDPVEGTPFPSIDAILVEKPDRNLLSELHNQVLNQNQEPESRTSTKKPAPEPTPQPPKAPANVAEAGSEATAKAGQRQGQGQEREGQDQTSQRSEPAKQALTPPSPPSPEPDDLRRYNVALEPNAERMAQEIRSQAPNITNANARMLVDVYGIANARAALILYGLQPKNSIPNPAGYIRALLRKHAVTAEDTAPPEQNGRRYVEGEYAAFIEH